MYSNVSNTTAGRVQFNLVKPAKTPDAKCLIMYFTNLSRYLSFYGQLMVCCKYPSCTG